MILFLQPTQDKHRINCSSLRHKAKLHLINSHYFTKPIFKHSPPPSFHAQEASRLYNNCNSWYHPYPWKFEPPYLESTELSFQIHYGLSHISQTSLEFLLPASSNQLQFNIWNYWIFPVIILFNVCTISAYTVYWAFNCISFHIMIPIILFIHDPFNIILPDYLSSLKHNFPSFPLTHLPPSTSLP